MAAVAAGLLCLGGCKTKEVIVRENRTDTLYITKQQRDSIWLHDSLYIHEYQHGDTVYLDRTKWHTKYVDRLRIDTIYQAKTDSVVTIQKVPAELTWWQQTRLHIANVVLWTLLLCGILWRIKRGLQ